MFAWIFFRSNNIIQAFNYIKRIFSSNFFQSSINLYPNKHIIFSTLVFFIIIEWLGREKNYAIENLFLKNKFLKYSFFILIGILIFIFQGKEQQFIYFQF